MISLAVKIQSVAGCKLQFFSVQQETKIGSIGSIRSPAVTSRSPVVLFEIEDPGVYLHFQSYVVVFMKKISFFVILTLITTVIKCDCAPFIVVCVMIVTR